MKVVKETSELRSLIKEQKATRNIVGFVPTMGFLHKGHEALIENAKKECDCVVVSIYVNPTQFTEGEDYKSYPRDIERDAEICRKTGADLIFSPSDQDMYPQGIQTVVEVGELGNSLCGKYRQGHFSGVSTVVAKLFNIVQPDSAYFGLKDYQQFRVIEKMAADLNFPVEIRGVETVRDDDGLATSSRNIYLNEDERLEAVSLYKSLCLAERRLKEGNRNANDLVASARRFLNNKNLIKIQYLEVVDPETLMPVDEIEGKVLIAVAAFVGKARLIDNLLISEMGDSNCSVPC